MAEKRMFSSNVMDSDAFLDMSPTARLLYYDMGMRADDDGFIDSPKKIMRIIGASDSDLKELIDNGFVLRFESGVIVIRHWYVNNRVRRDTYHETIYTEEKSRLLLEKNNVYQLRNDSVTDTLQTRDEIGSQIRGGEDRIDKDRLGKEKEISPTRHKYGEYQNVLLTDEDLEKLKKEFFDWSDRIERLSAYMASTGKSYKNHLATIRNWARRDSRTPTADVKPKGQASYDISEFERQNMSKPIAYKKK